MKRRTGKKKWKFGTIRDGYGGMQTLVIEDAGSDIAFLRQLTEPELEPVNGRNRNSISFGINV